MLNFHRAVELLAPSVPRHLRAEATAAARTSATGPCGEAGPVADQDVDAASRPGVDQPEGGGGRLSSFGPSPLSGVPAVESLLNWRAHPAHRWEFADTYLADMVGRWRQELA